MREGVDGVEQGPEKAICASRDPHPAGKAADDSAEAVRTTSANRVGHRDYSAEVILNSLLRNPCIEPMIGQLTLGRAEKVGSYLWRIAYAMADQQNNASQAKGPVPSFADEFPEVIREMQQRAIDQAWQETAQAAMRNGPIMLPPNLKRN